MAASGEHVDFLRSIDLFAHLPTRLLKRLAQTATEVDHANGHVVVRQGAGAHLLHVIISGTATVSANGHIVAELGPGDYFGEIALLEGGKRTATVTAATDLRILGLDPVAFRRLVATDPELAARLPDSITVRLRELNEKLPS